MKHTIVIDIEDYVAADKVEGAITAAIESAEMQLDSQSVVELQAKVVAYHREDITSMEEDDTITYGPDVPKRWVERRMDQMHEGDSFGIHDVEGDAVLRVVKYSDDPEDWTYTAADRRVRHGSRAEVLEELFPS